MLGVLALLGVSLLAGIGARRMPVFPEQTPAVLSAVILNLALPALVIRVLHGVTFTPALAVGAAMLWLQFGAAVAVFALVRRHLGLSRETWGALALTAGLSNTAYVGLPVIELVLGREALGPAVVVDQLGSFLVMATLGITFAAALSGKTPTAKQIARRVLLFPPFLALVLGVLLRPVALPPWVLETLDRLGALLTPLALFTVGFQLRLSGIAGRGRLLVAGLGFKLVLSPLLVVAVMALIPGPSAGNLDWQVVVMQAAMPPMVTGAIIASDHRLDPPLAAAMLGVGIPLSAASLAVVAALIT